MIFKKISNLKYITENKSHIDLFATCEEYGEIPMTLNLVDTEDIHNFATGTFDEDKNEILIPLEEYCKKQKIAPYVEPEPVVIIPTQITMRQTRLYLLSIDLLDEVENIVSQNKAWQIEWEYASEVLRTNQLIQAMQTSLNLTNSQVDDMFSKASKL
jgi:hypothetical protein